MCNNAQMRGLLGRNGDQGLRLSGLISAMKRQNDRWFLWSPVALASGAGAYFSLPREPHWLVFAVFVLAVLFLLWLRVFRRGSFALVLMALVLGGAVVGKFHVVRLDTKVLRATTPTVQVTGWLERVEASGPKRARLYLHIEKVQGIKPEALPDMVRLSGRGPVNGVSHGDRIEVRARLFTLPSPVSPRGFDFGRKLWFEGVGATGFFYGKVSRLEGRHADHSGLVRGLQDLRAAIAQRVRTVLAGELGGVAVALITGDRSGMSRKTVEALRDAGLAHILAISGLHMSLVAGGLFWVVRALLALSPRLLLHYPIKKWAAMVALSGAGFYLVLSGASIATQRAFIMLSIMLIAVLLNRPAISMRNVAIAAIIVILINPFSVLSVSFQMSFLAVVGLVAVYEQITAWRRQLRFTAPSNPWLRLGVYRPLAYTGGLALTTLVAGVFTGLPAAYHFHSIAIYSLAGNLVALPIVTLVVMPAAVLAMVLMPMGLESVGLEVMGFGIDLVREHAARVASWKGARQPVAEMHTLAVLILTGALIWMCIWRGWLKGAAVPIGLVALVFLPGGKTPDVLVSKFGRNVAIVGDEGRLILADARKSRFSAERWLVAKGDRVSLKSAATRKGWTCAGDVCKGRTGSYAVLYVKKLPKKGKLDCGNAVIVIAAEPLKGQCRSAKVRIDRFDLWRGGAHAVYVRKGLLVVESAKSYRGHRPWVIDPIARRKILTNPPPKPKERPPGPKRTLENERA